MTNRITGTNSGIDVDAVVKQSLSTEQNKIDKALQNQKVYEYQQEQLRDIVKSSTDFYDKYLDILSSDSLLKSSVYESVSFAPTNSSDASVSVVGMAGASVDNYTVQLTQVAEKASATIKTDDLSSIKDGKLSFAMDGSDPIEIDLVFNTDGAVDMEATAKELNSELSKKNINVTAKFSQFSKGIVIESNNTGADVSFEVKVTDELNSSNVLTYSGQGKNAEGKILKGNDEYIINQSTNSLTLDNVKFEFKTANASVDSSGQITGGTTLVGKTDVTKLKDTIVNFVNDYNKLMETINGKLWETRDKSYMPLTDDQKSEMTDKQIEDWEKKAQTGLLRGDDDLKRIQNAMKSAMSSMMSDTGLNLESIGIKPVDNYTTKNGMFTIDEEALTKALETNAEGVKDLFTRASSTDSKGGVLTQLQSVLKSEVKSSSSALAKKIGFAGTATENNNTYTTKITNQKKLISELKEKYTTKETSLYKKYSNLEVMLEKLNSQSNSLYSMLGLN